MAGPTQYGFDLQEVAIALIKEQKIYDGKWAVLFDLNLAGGVFGATPANSLPGAFMQIKRVLLAQADPAMPERFIVDASVVNPAPSVKTSTTKPK